MAQKETGEAVDDLGRPAPEGGRTVRFGLDGVEWEADLSAAEAARLRELLGRYVPYARRMAPDVEPPVNAAPPTPVRSLDVAELRAVRTWARANGFSVSDHGRIAAAVLEAFEQAHPGGLLDGGPPSVKFWD